MLNMSWTGLLILRIAVSNRELERTEKSTAFEITTPNKTAHFWCIFARNLLFSARSALRRGLDKETVQT